MIKKLAQRVIDGYKISFCDAKKILNFLDDKILELVNAAYLIRTHFFQNKIRLNFLLNAQSGLCSEDCYYCSQSKISKADIRKYTLVNEQTIIDAAKKAVQLKAHRFCIVTSGKTPNKKTLDYVSNVVKKIKTLYPQLEICASLGLIDNNGAKILKDSGLNFYNHNINTSKGFYKKICTTHSFSDRIKTIYNLKKNSISICCGVIYGMGESDDDVINSAIYLQKIKPQSIPVNFLIPIKGTPLENQNHLNPFRCLKILSLIRFANPDSEIRMAAGREVHLGWLQPLSFLIANSIFIGDYLTTKGQLPQDDYNIIKDLGLEIEFFNKSKLSVD